MHTVYFRLNNEGDPQVPTKGYEGDAGWDLYCSRTCVVPPGELVDIHTDIHVAMPRGFYGRITSRSSTLRNHGMLVSEGIIDNGWRGELFISAWNTGDQNKVIHVGDRLAQLIFSPIFDFAWVQTEELSPTQRGGRGFGSTGR